MQINSVVSYDCKTGKNTHCTKDKISFKGTNVGLSISEDYFAALLKYTPKPKQKEVVELIKKGLKNLFDLGAILKETYQKENEIEAIDRIVGNLGDNLEVTIKEGMMRSRRLDCSGAYTPCDTRLTHSISPNKIYDGPILINDVPVIHNNIVHNPFNYDRPIDLRIYPSQFSDFSNYYATPFNPDEYKKMHELASNSLVDQGFCIPIFPTSKAVKWHVTNAFKELIMETAEEINKEKGVERFNEFIATA